MKKTGDEKHAVRVTRTATTDGGAVYHVTVSPESEAVIQGGCAIEGMTPGIWIASSIHVRLFVLARVLATRDAKRTADTPDTVN